MDANAAHNLSVTRQSLIHFAVKHASSADYETTSVYTSLLLQLWYFVPNDTEFDVLSSTIVQLD